MEIISLVCILIALAAMMYFGYRGTPIILVAPLCGIFVCLTSGLDLAMGMGTTYLNGLGNWVGSYFFTLFTGAIFGCVMTDSGAARSIGLKLSSLATKFKGHEKIAAIWCIPILSFVLSYGGISVFVAFFTVIAIAKELFEKMDIPWRLYGVGSLGVSALALTMAPGSPSVNNNIASNYLSTTAMAVLIAILLGHLYFSWELRNVRRDDEHFLPTGTQIAQVDLLSEAGASDNFKEMNIFLALAPSILLIILLNLVGLPVYIASFVAILAAYILFWNRLHAKVATAQRGAVQAITSACTVALVVGFGSVVASTSGYQVILDALAMIPDSLGYFQVIIAVNLAAGVTGSSSGGLSIALDSLSDRFLNVLNLNPEAVHRIACISSGGLDSLPCNGTVLNELAMAKLPPRVGYRPMFVLTVITPILTSCLIGLVATFIGGL